ncbi:cytochrome b5-like heme/steroid binding domain-containing protein [Xylaria digitata]|nr:cytochrome b5-like heme/steroid binding domain-containing protein [Xylaria digitata]
MAGKFEPKVPVNLNPPKDDPITLEELAQANGAEGQKAYVAIKASYHHISHAHLGKVYDVSGNKAYRHGGTYNVFAGKDASRALAKSSKEPEDVQPEWRDLDEERQGVLNDWITFFSKRYNIVGVVQGATNME